MWPALRKLADRWLVAVQRTVRWSSYQPDGQSGPGAHIFKENRLLGAPTLKISPAALVTCGAHCCTRPGPRPPTRHSHACMVRWARRRPGRRGAHLHHRRVTSAESVGSATRVPAS